MNSVLLMVALLNAMRVVHGSKILMVPVLNTSQFLEMDGVGRVLKQRGHDVYVVMGSQASIPKQAQDVGYKRLDYQQVKIEGVSKETEEAIVQQGLAAMRKVGNVFTQLCTDMLADEHLLQQIQQLHFDIAIVTNADGVMPCPLILAYMANLTYISYRKQWLQFVVVQMQQLTVWSSVS
jgi:hypothetical protein